MRSSIKAEFLAVGRELRIGTFHGGGGQQHFFFNQRGVREVRVFLAGYLGKVELPVAASLAGVGQGAVVRRKGEAASRAGVCVTCLVVA